jgi:hypothetical protein
MWLFGFACGILATLIVTYLATHKELRAGMFSKLHAGGAALLSKVKGAIHHDNKTAPPAA